MPEDEPADKLAPLIDQHISGEDWYGRSLDGESFIRCRFDDVDLSEIVTRGATFAGCTFQGVRLNASRHDGSAFTACTFRETSFFDAELVGCKLVGSSFDRCTLQPLAVRGGNWSFVSLRGARLVAAELHDVRLTEADLAEADLTRALIRDCDLSRADLRGARLPGADLRGSTLAGVDPLPVRWSGARLDLAQAVTLAEALGATVDP